jgi:hypothetical protein
MTTTAKPCPAYGVLLVRSGWHARGCYIYLSGDPRDCRQVARVPTVPPPNGDAHPVAKLIASAPELLTACQAALRFVEDRTEGALGRELVVQLREAIAKSGALPSEPLSGLATVERPYGRDSTAPREQGVAMDLRSATEQELQAELERRKRPTVAPPTRIAGPDWSRLVKTIVEGVARMVADGREDEDFKSYVYEAAMEAVYGKTYWAWHNAQKW